MREKLTQKMVRQFFNYNPDTGIITYKKQMGPNAMIGMAAGCKDNIGYIRVCINGFNHLAHRLAFLWMDGYLPENEVDHIDRNPSNNKWNNLREVSRTCNARNRKIQKNNKSGITGVFFRPDRKKWVAKIKPHDRQINLGNFKEFKDAVIARWEAEKKYDFPNCCTTSPAYKYLYGNN